MRGRACIVALVVALSGCIDPHLVACGDGTVCPVGTVCVTGGGCAGQDQLTACEGLADGDPCFVLTLGTGTCVDGACIVPVCGNARIEPGEACDDGNDVSNDGCNATCTSTGACGNGVTDPGEECDCGDGTMPSPCAEPNAASPTATCRADCILARCGNGLLDTGEACDDGNLVPGDGCMPDCSSDESCGNGLIDIFVAEECDDNNTRNHDGCDKKCRRESPVWRQRALPPLGRSDPGVAYDPFRQRIVMFGGKGNADMGDTWEWTGSGWLALTPANAPSARSSHGMVYDGKRRRVVLFGGRTNSGTVLGDTWEWDGANWTKHVPAMSPAPRHSFGMTYDVAHGQVVLFGGILDASGNIDAETWLYDGTTWTKAAPATSPGARRDHAIAYDSQRKRTVLFGGQTYTLLALNDTWEWDGTTWADVTPASGNPGRRTGHALAYDAAHGEVVLFGGYLSNYLADTWIWNGTRWLLRNDATPPSTRSDLVLAYHAQRARVVKLGGYCSGAGCTTPGWASTPEELAIDGSGTYDWTAIPLAMPSARDSAASAFDSTRGRAIMHGGEDINYNLLADTWAWDGAAWTQVATSSPSARAWHAMSDDPRRGQLVLFGGTGPTLDLDDTWTWNGGSWSQVLTPGPTAGSGYALACDATGGLVRFGNYTVAETVRWNGAWTALAPTMSPVNQTAPAMTFDVRRGLTVMFGEGETWEWDGADWVQHGPATSPGYRYSTSLTYDPRRGRTVLFGGELVLGAGNDIWEWDGTDWRKLTPAPLPPARIAPAAWHDALRAELVVFGGFDSSTFYDTWTMRWEGSGFDEACHAGVDYDADGKVGCADDECWAWCDPQCPPGATNCDAARPRCGDGVCSALESCHACPGDCVTCAAICGDFVCDPNESAATCAGDCP